MFVRVNKHVLVAFVCVDICCPVDISVTQGEHGADDV